MAGHKLAREEGLRSTAGPLIESRRRGEAAKGGSSWSGRNNSGSSIRKAFCCCELVIRLDSDASPTIQLKATWVGPPSELDAHMAHLHDLAGRLPAINAVQPNRSYLDVMFSYAGCAGTSAAQRTTEAGGSLQREAFSAASHVPYNLPNEAGAAQLVDRCVLGQQLHGARNRQRLSMLCEYEDVEVGGKTGQKIDTHDVGAGCIRLCLLSHCGDRCAARVTA